MPLPRRPNCNWQTRYADEVINACLFVYLLFIKTDHNQSSYLLKDYTEKKQKPLFLQLKPTETERQILLDKRYNMNTMILP